MKMTIVKYEKYPKDDPVSYAVGFEIQLQNGRSFYIDTQIGLDEIKSEMTDQEISALAYERLEGRIAEKVNDLKYAKPSIVGLELQIPLEHEESAVEIKASVDEMKVKLQDNTDVINTMLRGDVNEQTD